MLKRSAQTYAMAELKVLLSVLDCLGSQRHHRVMILDRTNFMNVFNYILRNKTHIFGVFLFLIPLNRRFSTVLKSKYKISASSNWVTSFLVKYIFVESSTHLYATFPTGNSFWEFPYDGAHIIWFRKEKVIWGKIFFYLLIKNLRRKPTNGLSAADDVKFKKNTQTCWRKWIFQLMFFQVEYVEWMEYGICTFFI